MKENPRENHHVARRDTVDVKEYSHDKTIQPRSFKNKAEVYSGNGDEIQEEHRKISPSNLNQHFHSNTILTYNKLELKNYVKLVIHNSCFWFGKFN